MDEAVFEEIERQGYILLEGAIPGHRVEELRQAMEVVFAEYEKLRGPFPSNERFIGNLTNKHPLFLQLLEETQSVRRIAERLLGPDYILGSLNTRCTWPYSPAQGLHRDHDGDLAPFVTYLQSIWLLDDFTSENGATVIVPETHRPEAGDPQPGVTYPVQSVIAPAGSVLVFPASLWHGGGEHRSGGPRRALHGYFCRPWCRPQFDNLRSAPQELLDSATPFQLQLLGFNAQRAWERSWGDWAVIEAQGQAPGLP
jgi:hypothetical protein